MDDLISICIPTYQRPDILRQALDSCLAQTYPAFEIVISDDSPDQSTEKMVQEWQQHCSQPVRYLRNAPSLGQAGNVNQLFDLARGDRLVLLHDDDLLLPNALADLKACFEAQPNLTAAFGKQYLIDAAGGHLSDEEVNAQFWRSARFEGQVLSPLEAALVQQFPNNSYLIQTAFARRVRYRSDQLAVIGNRWCDYDFGLRLAQAGASFYFLNQYTAKYRLSEVAVSKKGFPTYMFSLIESIVVAPSQQWAKNWALQRLAPIIIYNYIAKGQWRCALRVWLSSAYPWRRKLSKAGIFYGLLLLAPRNRALRRLRQKLKTG